MSNDRKKDEPGTSGPVVETGADGVEVSPSINLGNGLAFDPLEGDVDLTIGGVRIDTTPDVPPDWT